jgi:hypothetical protein
MDSDRKSFEGEACKCYGAVKITGEDLSKLAKDKDTHIEKILEARARMEVESDLSESRVGERNKVKDSSSSTSKRKGRRGKKKQTTSQAGAAALLLQAESRVLDLGLLQTPPPSISWPGPKSRTGIFPADPQISVSNTHVVITTNDTLAFYDKTGQLLQSFYPWIFFNPLNLNTLPLNIDTYFDVRTIFDAFRNRFWLGALAYNSAHGNDANRLTKFAVGVSTTENPLDGWYLYWWDAVAHDGVPNDPVFQPGDSGDFPSLGIDSFGIYQTNAVNNELSHQRRYWHVVFFPAGPLANGQTAGGWQYWGLTNPDGAITPEVIQPVVHHGPSPRVYFVSRYYGGGANSILVWALTDPLQPTQQIARVEVILASSPFGQPGSAFQSGSSQRIKMDNLGTDIMKAAYRDNLLYFTTNDAKDWFNDGRVLNSIRFVRLRVDNYPNISTDPASGFIDRTFGSNNFITDQPSDHMYYGWPAIEVNRAADIVIVYARSAERIYPEVRYSVRLFTEADIRPSRLLKTGEDPYELDYQVFPNDPGTTSSNELRWGDTAGASVDPSDDTSIWITQAYASDDHDPNLHVNNYALWVGKISVNSQVS